MKKEDAKPTESSPKPRRHKKEKELSDKEAMTEIVAQIDTDDGNDLISSFIKGDDGSKTEDSEGESSESTEAWSIFKRIENHYIYNYLRTNR